MCKRPSFSKPSFACAFITCLTTLGLASLAAAEDGIPATASSTGLLGWGYSARDQATKNNCSTYEPADVVWKGLNQSSFDFSITSSQDEVVHDLGIDIGGKYRTGVTETNASAKFTRNTKTAGHSISYTWVSQYDFAPLQLARFDFASEARSVLRPELPSWIKLDPHSPTYEADLWKKSDIRIVDPDRFFRSCGDEVVYKQEVHAKLYINIRVDFESDSEMNDFRVHFDLSSPSVAINTDVNKLDKHFSKRTKFTISALQVGGNTSALTHIFGKDGAVNGFGVVQCSFGDLAQCQGVLKDAINYSAGDFATQIPATAANMISLIGTPQGPAITMSYAKDWREANLRLLGDVSPQAKEFNAEAKRQLQVKFETIFEQWHKLVRISEVHLPRLSDTQEQRRAKEEASSYTSLKALKDAIQICYDRPLDCQSAYNDLLQTPLVVLQPSDFVFEAQSYAQFCDAVKANQQYLPGRLDPVEPGQKLIDVVTALNKFAESKDSAIPASSDYCASVEKQLNAIDTIDLSSASLAKLGLPRVGLFDLDPLKALTNMRRLDLSGHDFATKDLRGLSQMNQLRELRLDDNQISAVDFLAPLVNLEVLALNQNPLGDLSPLRNFTAIRLLELRNTGEDTVCPYTDRTEICDLVDYSSHGNFAHVRDYSPSRHVGHQALKFGDGIIRIFGGRAGSSNEYYDPAYDSLVEIPNSKSDRMWFSATNYGAAQERALIFGGSKPAGSAYVYEMNGTVRALKSPEITSRIFHRAETLPDGRVLIFGGFPVGPAGTSGVTALLTSLTFDEISEQFSVAPPMKEARAHHQSVVLDDGRVLVTGGVDRNGFDGVEADRVLNTGEIFDGKQFVRLTSHMKQPRFLHQMTKLADGRVLITGGFSKSESGLLKEPVKSAEIFNPKTNRFEALNSEMIDARAAHQAIRLSGGQVLILGGTSEFAGIEAQDDSTKSLDSAEIFDPARNRFVKLGRSMVMKRAFFTATDIGDRRVLIVGGLGSSSSSAEVFTYDF